MNEKRSLPKHWQVKKLGEAFTIERGGSPRPIKSFITDDENGINWIKIGDAKNSTKYIYRTKEKIRPDGVKRSRMVFEGDFLLSNSMSFGKPYIMKTSGCIHDGWLVIRKNEIIDNDYLYYILSSSSLYQQFLNLAKGSTVKNLNIDAVKQAVIQFPPLPEQQAIVAKIEELFSDLENGVQQLRTAQQQFKIYRQSLLKAAFEGRLSEEWRKNQESLTNSAELFEQIRTEKEKAAISSGKKLKLLAPISENERAQLPKLPKEWNWVKLGDNAFVTKLAGFEFTKYVKYKDAGDIPVIRAQNVSRYFFVPRNFLYVDREIMEKLPRSRVFGGEILMVFVGAGLGNVGIVPHNQEYFLGPNVAKIAVEKQFINRFILHFLTSQIGFANVTGMSKATAQGSISMANIREVAVPLISIEEQNFIVEELESKLAICDKIEESITHSLQQAETLRQSILKKAFEGKLVPHDGYSTM